MRARVVWNGFSGGPGVNTLHFGVTPEQNADAAQTILDALKTFYTGLNIYMPTGVSISFESQLEVINAENGQIENIVSASPPAPVTGSGSGGYSSGAGMCVHWITQDFRKGRRVRGRSFMVPLSAQAFDTTGTLNNTLITTMQGLGATLAANEAVQLSIFRRPVMTETTNTVEDPLVAIPGSQHRVTAVRISDKGAYLTSRRE